MQATFFLGSCTPRGFSTFASELAEECGAVDYIKGGSGCVVSRKTNTGFPKEGASS